MNTTALAARIWFLSTIILDSGIFIFFILTYRDQWYFFLPAFIAILVGGVPVLITMAVLLPMIRRFIDTYNNKIYLTILICGACAFVYGLAGFLIAYPWKYHSDVWLSEGLKIAGAITGILFCTALLSLQFSKKQLEIYFRYNKSFFKTNNKTNMETYNNSEEIPYEPKTNPSNRILIKGAITAALIGLMMIPTVFISDLVRERQERNEAVVKEVDSRWAMAQTISGPYIFLPYKFTTTDATRKAIGNRQSFINSSGE